MTNKSHFYPTFKKLTHDDIPSLVRNSHKQNDCTALHDQKKKKKNRQQHLYEEHHCIAANMGWLKVQPAFL